VRIVSFNNRKKQLTLMVISFKQIHTSYIVLKLYTKSRININLFWCCAKYPS